MTGSLLRRTRALGVPLQCWPFRLWHSGLNPPASAAPLLGSGGIWGLANTVSGLFTEQPAARPGQRHRPRSGAPLDADVARRRPFAGRTRRARAPYLAPRTTRRARCYHQFLTPSAFAAKFGVPAATRSAVISWLTANGLHVNSVSAAGDNYAVSGTASRSTAPSRRASGASASAVRTSWPTPASRRCRQACRSPRSSG